MDSRYFRTVPSVYVYTENSLSDIVVGSSILVPCRIVCAPSVCLNWTFPFSSSAIFLPFPHPVLPPIYLNWTFPFCSPAMLPNFPQPLLTPAVPFLTPFHNLILSSCCLPETCIFFPHRNLTISWLSTAGWKKVGFLLSLSVSCFFYFFLFFRSRRKKNTPTEFWSRMNLVSLVLLSGVFRFGILVVFVLDFCRLRICLTVVEKQDRIQDRILQNQIDYFFILFLVFFKIIP